MSQDFSNNNSGYDSDDENIRRDPRSVADFTEEPGYTPVVQIYINSDNVAAQHYNCQVWSLSSHTEEWLRTNNNQVTCSRRIRALREARLRSIQNLRRLQEDQPENDDESSDDEIPALESSDDEIPPLERLESSDDEIPPLIAASSSDEDDDDDRIDMILWRIQRSRQNYMSDDLDNTRRLRRQ